MRRKRTKVKPAKVIRTTHDGNATDYFIENEFPIGPEEFLNKCEKETKRVLKIQIPSKTTVNLQGIFTKIGQNEKVD